MSAALDINITKKPKHVPQDYCEAISIQAMLSDALRAYCSLSLTS